MNGRFFQQGVGFLGQLVALFAFRADIKQTHARLLHALHAAHIDIAHDGKLPQVFRLAVHICAAVNQQKIALAVGHQRGQGGAVNAIQATQAEHARGQHRAGGTGGHKAVCFAIAHGHHAAHDAAVLHGAHGHDGGIVVGDHLRGMLHGDALAHIVAVHQQGRKLCGVTPQGNPQVAVRAQGLNGALRRAFGRVVPAHRVQINARQLRSPSFFP